MKVLLCLATFAISIIAQAGSHGYVHQGKTVYLFKNGKRVEAAKEVREISRTPASSNLGMILFFTEDEFARCYYWAPKSGESEKKNIHCFKLSEIK